MYATDALSLVEVAVTSRNLSPAHSLVGHHAPVEGANESDWRGLIFYRFERPVAWQCELVDFLALYVVGQGRHCVHIDGTEYVCDPFHYLVGTRGTRFRVESLEATPAMPLLSFVLQIESAIAQEVLAELHCDDAALCGLRPWSASGIENVKIRDAVFRFLGALEDPNDRTVLAPLYLHEIAYRLIKADQGDCLAREVRKNSAFDPVSGAIRYMNSNIRLPLTVAQLADAVHMSPSGFAHLFRQTTGMAPYQFLKTQRLNTARASIALDRAAHRRLADVAAEVGYGSLSHFIFEFKRHFGETPGAYAQRSRSARAHMASELTNA